MNSSKRGPVYGFKLASLEIVNSKKTKTMKFNLLLTFFFIYSWPTREHMINV